MNFRTGRIGQIDTDCWVHATSHANLASINAEGLVKLNKCQDSSYDGVLSLKGRVPKKKRRKV